MDLAKVENAAVAGSTPAVPVRRSIRCDKTLHCSSCKLARVPCERKFQLKHKTKAQRVLISPEYREKIDHIDERLEQITDMLLQMKEQAEIAVEVHEYLDPGQEYMGSGPRPHRLLIPKVRAK
ncbi:fungal specific transcription factor domain-containing protein [Colletotrichum sojae]|uniref:Fungal specific transcription factor domain-containing protein n=1 Tax=Colletotrichum sojae TaxID=2175907 RepID=A0A8H6IYU1_9PEZI|nr:fungal specific transcription factor domain-containing protein [Colletotrichum sojae]